MSKNFTGSWQEWKTSILIANCYGLRGWCWCRSLDGNHGAQTDVYHGADYTPPHQAAPQPQEDERWIAAMLMKTDDSCSSKTCQVGHVLFKSSPFLHTGGYLSGMSSYTKWFMFMFIFAEKLKLTEKCSKGWFVWAIIFFIWISERPLANFYLSGSPVTPKPLQQFEARSRFLKYWTVTLFSIIYPFARPFSRVLFLRVVAKGGNAPT